MPTNLKQTVDKYIGDVIRHNHTDLVDIYNDQTINGTKTLLGDVNVYGTFHAASAVIINTEIIDVSANYITLNSNLTGAPFETAGIKVNRGAEVDSVLEWNELTGRWSAGVMGSTDVIVLSADLPLVPLTRFTSPQITKKLYVDGNRTDSYTPDGSEVKPFLTIGAATAIATSHTLIKVMHGTYTENVVLPDGVSIEGYASNHTIINGNLTTTASSNMSIRYIQVGGNNTVTLNSPVELIDCYIVGAVIVNNVVTQCYNTFIIPSNAGVVPLTLNGASARHQHFLSTITAIGNTQAVVLNNGLLIFDVVQVTNNGAADCIYAADGQAVIINSWIINSGGGNAINIDNGATTTSPNAIANIFSVGNIVCGSANTIIEGKYNITGTLSGTAIIRRPATLISSDTTNFVKILSPTATTVQLALDEIDDKLGTVFSMVSSTSANWNNVFSSVSANSANWNSVYSTVGASSAKWEISDYIPISGSNNIYGSLVPSVSTITLGTSSNPWSGLFVSSGSLHIGNNKISSNISGQLLINNIPIITSNNINIDSSGNMNNINAIQFDITPTSGTHSTGRLHFNDIFGTLDLDINSDVVLQIGQETLCYVYNGTGSPIINGQVVYILGAQNGIPSIGLADATDVNKSFVLGVVTNTSIDSGSYGYATIRGHVNGLDTSLWSVNTTLYLSDTSPGALTSTAPSAGNYDVRVGRVMIQDASIGRVYINIRPMMKLTDLGDVTIDTPITDQILRYNGAEWVNGNAVAVNAGAGVDFFLDDTMIIPTGTDNDIVVQTLNRYPVSATAEEIDTITVNNNTVPYGTYLYNTAIGGTSLDAGVWTFDIYAGVSSSQAVTVLLINMMRVRPGSGTVTITGTGTSRTATASEGTPFAEAKIDASATNSNASYLQTPLGLYQITARTSDTEITITTTSGYTNESTVAFSVHKKLFQVTTGEMNNIASAPLYAELQLYSINSAQAAYTIESTDKLASMFFGKTTRTSSTNIYFSHNGTSRYSFFKSPLIVRHNELSALQGGAANDFYHLTSAQHTIATQAASISNAGYMTTDVQTLSGVKTFANFPITPSSAPITDYQIANRKFVTDNIGINIVGGRLTLESGVPVSTTDQLAKTTLYYTPYMYDRIALFNGSNWIVYTFTEKSLNISAYTASKPYDIFIYDNSGTLTLEGVVWTNDTTRATVLTTQNGVYVQTGAANKRYLGTIMITGTTGECELSFGKTASAGGSKPTCFIWNQYNRTTGSFFILDSTNEWTYTTATWRQRNAGTATNNLFKLINGTIGSLLTAKDNGIVQSTAQVFSAVGYDATNAYYGIPGVSVASTSSNITSMLNVTPTIGYHYVVPLEASTASGTSTWYGDAGGPTFFQAGTIITWEY